jgi:hypothetical protein
MGQPVGFGPGVQVGIDQPQLGKTHGAQGPRSGADIFRDFRFNQYKGQFHDITSGGEFTPSLGLFLPALAVFE